MRIPNIFARKKHQVVIGKPGSDYYHLLFEHRRLPSAGGDQYALLTMGLPADSPIGPSVMTKRPLRETTSTLYQYQAVSLVSVTQTGVLQGQFISQPLINPQNAGYIPSPVPVSATAFNQIPNANGNHQMAVAA